MRIIDSVLKFVFFLSLFLIVAGGGVLHIGKAKIEVGSLDLFVLASMLIFGIYHFFNRNVRFQVWDWLKFVVEKLSSKKAFWGIFCFFFVYLVVVHIFKNITLNTHGADQSFVHQALFYPFESTALKCDLCTFQSFFGEHLAFTFYLVAPLLSLFKSDILVYVLEVGLIFSSILLMFRAVLNDKKHLWGYTLLLILAHRSLRVSMVWDFREDHIAFFFMSLALVSLYKRSILGYIISIAAVLLSKENFPYLVPFLVFPIWFEKDFSLSRNKKILLSIYTIGVSVFWMVMIAKVIGPYFNDGKPP
ncbi:MAG: DUF2079 domain-containing protein, partial [Bacteriovoracaceae bacterium]|nr:DUF2079 domain-containing protein [Bacteriovoracaceae bacterium]